MEGTTKILTVSYGTFSCTLEGFDDPLGAMRDIAEYFRDLAADDRYFGAEPPTPDPEMLQNIAQKEVNRRVEARLSDTGVALRQVENGDDEASADVEILDDTAKGVTNPKDVSPATEAEDASAMAARVVSAARTAEVVEDVVENAADTVDDSGPLAFDDEYLMSDEPEDILAVDPTVQISDANPAETVAEKLRRIRAVVSKNIEAQPGQPTTSRDHLVEDVPEEVSAKRDRALTDTIEAITADLAEDEAAEDIEAPAEDAEARKPATSEDAESDADTLSVDAAEETLDAAEQDAQSTDVAESDDPVVSEDDDTDPDEGPSPARDISQPLWSNDEARDASSEAAAEPSDTEDKKTETVGADGDGDDKNIKRTISDIIGSVSGRISEDDDEAQDHEVTDEAPSDQPAKRERPITQTLSEEQEGDVGRLMAETDNKLNEDEVVRRRRVISQMRAAVAATKADRLVSRQVSREVVEQEEQSPYREDLSEVVRPNADTKADANSAPPLVLVSSQRVDEANGAAGSDQKPEIGATSFADFASTMGAKELPELLEAAAAYTVFGEGQSSFTRPEIMKRVAAVDPTIRMSREESLRSFGQLLRQGKFRKLERGQFTIDQDTQYHPKHRAAG